jgi:hypothetical protein
LWPASLHVIRFFVVRTHVHPQTATNTKCLPPCQNVLLSNDDDPSKKGKRKNPNTYAQKGLGFFGIKRSKKIVHRGEVEVVPPRWQQLMKLKPNPDDEKIKPQGLKLPYNIPTESEAYPEVLEVRESASSIESCIDYSINDEAMNSGNEIVVDEEENDFIHEIMAYLGMPVSDVNEEMYLAIEHVCNTRAV